MERHPKSSFRILQIDRRLVEMTITTLFTKRTSLLSFFDVIVLLSSSLDSGPSKRFDQKSRNLKAEPLNFV